MNASQDLVMKTVHDSIYSKQDFKVFTNFK